MNDLRRRFLATSRVTRSALRALGLVALTACSDDPSTNGGAGDGGATPPVSSADGIDEALLAKCPQASGLVQTTEWMTCLAGKRLAGTETFNGQPCELRIGANGAFEYLRSGTKALELPDRSSWRNASGTYTNSALGGPRFFLAGISPDVALVDGQASISDINISLSALPGKEDTVEVKYFDAARSRQNYNCTVQAL